MDALEAAWYGMVVESINPEPGCLVSNLIYATSITE